MSSLRGGFFARSSGSISMTSRYGTATTRVLLSLWSSSGAIPTCPACSNRTCWSRRYRTDLALLTPVGAHRMNPQRKRRDHVLEERDRVPQVARHDEGQAFARIQPTADIVRDLVGDKGYHSTQMLVDLDAVGSSVTLTTAIVAIHPWTLSEWKSCWVVRVWITRARIHAAAACHPSCIGTHRSSL